eukprot:TRINITY_DN10554_c0_g1_i1.p1 TRINITY_DN10554_c0_g1~~TRINITY_DN10554_c0_g1_i1.p1  ORF type:complete len:568 (-),score=146.28 TRINITY_DN10554_c0_g1_i1:105-1742(-)
METPTTRKRKLQPSVSDESLESQPKVCRRLTGKTSYESWARPKVSDASTAPKAGSTASARANPGRPSLAEIKVQIAQKRAQLAGSQGQNSLAQRRAPQDGSKAQKVSLADIKAQVARQRAQMEGNREQNSLLKRASMALQPQGNDGQLPCREGEQEEVSKFLRLAIRSGGSSNVLYVSGMPGTGKTASVLQAVEKLQAASKQTFVFVHVNAMCLSKPAAVFGEILQQLQQSGAVAGNGRRCAAASAAEKLQSFFERRGSKPTVVVLLIDELDCLATRNQAVLYRIFNWLTLPGPSLVITAISNTMDLPERLLPRVSSRFGLVRVDFQPYKRDQIHEILNQRLRSRDAAAAFDMSTLKLCAARVAAGSGDIRKALQLCKRSLELRAEEQGQSGPVTLDHLRAAEKDLLHANPSAFAVHNLGLKARLFLLALLVELRKREAETVPLRKVSSRYGKLLAALKEGRQADYWTVLDETNFLTRRLESMTLIAVILRTQETEEFEAGSGPSKDPLLSLNSLDLDDLGIALKESETDENVLELLNFYDNEQP